MNRSDLADLNAFVVVANHLSFRAASTQLGVTASALSHSMRQLEERHGVRLLHRTTHSVSLTDAGLRLLEQLRPAIDQISGALENLHQQRQRPFGRLRIHATHIAAAAAIAAVWGRFASTYPDVHLEILVETRPIDLVASSFDAGIGRREWAGADMIAVRVIGPMKVAMVGAPEYFEQRPPPRTLDDLASHSCIQYRFAPNEAVLQWSFRSGTAGPRGCRWQAR
jgi:DNA-binding transcriptional LysR family regulator